MTTTTFKKVHKKYSLVNSYFKNMPPNWPVSILEILRYQKEHEELPFNYSGNNWPYDAFNEKKKRERVYLSQFFTPDATASLMADFANEYGNGIIAVDMCCGNGQITKALINAGFQVNGYEMDTDLVTFCQEYFNSNNFHHFDYRENNLIEPATMIVSNPPYEDLPVFLNWLANNLVIDGISVLLIPTMTFQKDKPKALVEARNRFSIVHRQDMTEPFQLTKITAEIIVLRKVN